MKKAIRYLVLGVLLVATGCAFVSERGTKDAALADRPARVDERYDFGGFLAPGNWYKGNLHLHSTFSDGKLDPLETVEVYRNAGYDFVALTDHIGGFKDKDTGEFRPLVYPLAELNKPGFLVMPGMEYDTNREGEVIHFVVIGPGYDRHLEKGEDLSHAVGKWTNAGGFVFFAHPGWSLNTTNILEDMSVTPGLEVFNYGVAYGQGVRGNSQHHWDRLLRQSRRCLGVATDDAHRPNEVSCGGWVVVKAESLEARRVVEALRTGRFYFSSGPSLENVFFDTDGNIHVTCSPVKTIRAMSTVGKSERVVAKPGKTIRHAVIEWDWEHWGGSQAPFVRVECIDSQGQTAWTQAVFPIDAAQ